MANDFENKETLRTQTQQEEIKQGIHIRNQQLRDEPCREITGHANLQNTDRQEYADGAVICLGTHDEQTTLKTLSRYDVVKKQTINNKMGEVDMVTRP